MKRFGQFILCAMFVMSCDQVVKAWIRHEFELGQSRVIVPGWLHFTYVLNHGAAWGVLSGQRWLLVGVATVVVFLVCLAARDMGQRSVLSNVGLGLILGGALGNLIDRIASGAVTDFVDLDTPWRYLQTFPVWNVADAALTVGVTCLLLDFLRGEKAESEVKAHAEIENEAGAV